MPWFWYKRGGWEIAVDAVSHQDAAQHIRANAFGAEYVGSFNPPTSGNYSMATAMTTEKRQEQISANVRRETE